MSEPRYLVDTNVLLRAADPDSAHHQAATMAITHLLSTDADLCLIGQNLIEFWVVATRPPEVNGMGWAPSKAQLEIAQLQVAFVLLPDTPAIFHQWARLVAQHNVQGVQAHDCRVVAAMLTHGLTHLLTFNASHFWRYETGEGITVVDPTTTAAL